MAMVLANDEADYAIKPEAAAPAVDTNKWPLLLKGYDRRESLLSLGKLALLIYYSMRSYWTFHSYTLWLHSLETRYQILH